MYYVYILIDPRNNQPFYVGKGKGHRAKSHLKETKENTENMRKFNKIQKIVSAGLSIIVEYYKKDIEIENDAYNIEENLIAKYGRKDYDANGILTNICKNSRPPGSDNFITNNPGLKMKGKTYEELYGKEKADELKAKRKVSSSLRPVTYETKEKMRAGAKKKMENGYMMPSREGVSDSEETRIKKSESHKGKTRGPMSEETKKKISDAKRKQ